MRYLDIMIISEQKFRPRSMRHQGWDYAGYGWYLDDYDHVIRNEKDLDRIRMYIHENPERWAFDEENPMNWR